MQTVKEMEGEQILALIPLLDQTKYQSVRLIKVEEHGLWIESQMLTNAMLQYANVLASPKTPIYFFPWHEVRLIVGSLEVPALDDSSIHP